MIEQIHTFEFLDTLSMVNLNVLKIKYRDTKTYINYVIVASEQTNPTILNTDDLETLFWVKVKIKRHRLYDEITLSQYYN